MRAANLSAHIATLFLLPQGLGIDADYRGVLQLRNAPFVGAEAYYKMSEEACALLPAEVAVPRHPGASLLPVACQRCTAA